MEAQPSPRHLRQTDTADLNRGVRIAPSAACELFWVLFKLERARRFDEKPELGPAQVSAALAVEASTFWGDGVMGFTELLVLAQWAGSLVDTSLNAFLERIANVLTIADFREIGLASELPQHREAMELRIRRLQTEPPTLTRYVDLLARVWSTVEPSWRTSGLPAVIKACHEWRRRLQGSARLTDLLPNDHVAVCLGLAPLVDAAAAKNQVVLSPCYFIRQGHIVDMPGTLSVGVKLEEHAQVDAFSDSSNFVSRVASLLANSHRVAVLSVLLDKAASATEVASRLQIPMARAKSYIRDLRKAGLAEPLESEPAKYLVKVESLDTVLDEISARLIRGYGRAARLEASLLASEASFRAIFDKAPIAIIQFDLEGRVLSCNSAAESLFGYREAEMGQLRTVHLLGEEGDEDVFELFDRRDQPTIQRREIRLRHRDGDLFWGSVTVSLVRNQSGARLFGYAMIEGLMERRGIEDLVTGLPNRAVFLDRLNRALSLSRREHQAIAVLVMDLNGFKQVNDNFGHDAGDALLKQVSTRLTGALRQTDTIARLGGDEFAVLPVGASTEAAAVRVAEKIEAAFAEPFRIADQDLRVGGSLGIALSLENGDSVEALLRRADLAMYIAKRSRQGHVMFRDDFGDSGDGAKIARSALDWQIPA